MWRNRIQSAFKLLVILTAVVCLLFTVVQMRNGAYTSLVDFVWNQPQGKHQQGTRAEQGNMSGLRLVHIRNTPPDPRRIIQIFKRNFPKVTAVSCDGLTSVTDAGKNETQEAKDHSRADRKDQVFLRHTSCADFKRNRGYITSTLTNEEAAFPIAFSLLIYKDIGQAERLLRAIYRPQNYYCIHVDKKASEEDKQAMGSVAECFENVFIASQAIDVRWGWFSVVEPELVCMQDLWRYKKWRYFINLTGQEFPLKTNLELVKILKAYDGANDIGGTVKRRPTWRTEYIHHGIKSTDIRKAPLAFNMTLTKGPVHITASRGYVDFVLHDSRALMFREWVNDTGVPDETFFSSLNHNPQWGVPGSYNGEPEIDLIKRPFLTRFKVWKHGMFSRPCAGKWRRALCVFGVGDLPLLVARPELFANKFHYYFEPLAYDCLEEWHFKKIVKEYEEERTFDVSFYANLSIVKNKV